MRLYLDEVDDGMNADDRRFAAGEEIVTRVSEVKYGDDATEFPCWSREFAGAKIDPLVPAARINSRSFLLVPPPPRCVMDVQYLDGVVTHAIEDCVRIATERRHSHVRSARGAAHAFRPAGNMGDDNSQAPFDSTAESG